jgi:hypothetical protein
MRWVVCAMLVIAACKEGRAPAHDPPVQPGSAAAPTPSFEDPWKRIEVLAAPTHTAGSSRDLERALPLAAANGEQWRELEFRRPAPPLADYPQGAEAMALVRAWASVKGGLPKIPSPAELGSATFQVFSLGSTAAAVATNRDELAPAVYLGTLLVTNGRTLLEVQMGASILLHASHKLRDLAGPDAKAEPLPAPELDLVRVLAAEALHSRALLEWSMTDNGQKTLGSAMASLGSDSRELTKQVFGKDPEAMIPTKTDAAAYDAFWIAALDGAQRGEPANVTLDRLKKAAEGAPPSIKYMVTHFPQVAESITDDLERVKNPAL